MDAYWKLFLKTGEPVFYLLYRRGRPPAEQARVAMAEQKAREV